MAERKKRKYTKRAAKWKTGDKVAEVVTNTPVTSGLSLASAIQAHAEAVHALADAQIEANNISRELPTVIAQHIDTMLAAYAHNLVPGFSRVSSGNGTKLTSVPSSPPEDIETATFNPEIST